MYPLTTSTPTAATVHNFLLVAASGLTLVVPTHFTVPLNTSSLTDFTTTRSSTLNFDLL